MKPKQITDWLVILSAMHALAIAACSNPANERIKLNKELFGQPLVPQNIIWQTPPSSDEHPILKYSKFRTYYFVNDSIVYAIDCINENELNCKDTSIYSLKEKELVDTSICTFEDSILFGVENIELYKGHVEYIKNKIICDMATFNDTLTIAERGGNSTLIRQGQPYSPAKNFKMESYKRLAELLDIERKR